MAPDCRLNSVVLGIHERKAKVIIRVDAEGKVKGKGEYGLRRCIVLAKERTVRGQS